MGSIDPTVPVHVVSSLRTQPSIPALGINPRRAPLLDCIHHRPIPPSAPYPSPALYDWIAARLCMAGCWPHTSTTAQTCSSPHQISATGGCPLIDGASVPADLGLGWYVLTEIELTVVAEP